MPHRYSTGRGPPPKRHRSKSEPRTLTATFRGQLRSKHLVADWPSLLSNSLAPASAHWPMPGPRPQATSTAKLHEGGWRPCQPLRPAPSLAQQPRPNQWPAHSPLPTPSWGPRIFVYARQPPACGGFDATRLCGVLLLRGERVLPAARSSSRARAAGAPRARTLPRRVQVWRLNTGQLGVRPRHAVRWLRSSSFPTGGGGGV